MIPPATSNVLTGLVVSLAAAAFSMVVGYVGIVRQPGADRLVPPPRRSIWPVLSNAQLRRHLVRAFLAVSISGALGTLLGGTHPYWAMVAAVAGISGRGMRARVTRAIHRLFGTWLGVLVAAPVLLLYPRGVWAVLLVMIFQIAAELLVGRNYMLALLAVTPLALLMGQLVAEVPVKGLLIDRALETLLGCAVALGVLYFVRDRRVSPMDKD